MNRIGGMCFNWKVVAALAAVGLGIWVVAPNLVAALPLLLLAACPLSMLLMMRGMQGGQCASLPQTQSQPEPTSQPAAVALTREEQIAVLKAQLAGVQAQQQAIAREIARLEAADAPAAVSEAPLVACAADERLMERNQGATGGGAGT